MYGSEWQKLKQLRNAQKTRQQGFDIAELRYKSGESDFLVILDAQRSLFNINNKVITSETKMLTSLTRLYKSLGGGWEFFNNNGEGSAN